VRQMLSAIAGGKREQIITSHGKVLVLLDRFVPWTIRALTHKFAPRQRQ
jgi:hypothetical protein